MLKQAISARTLQLLMGAIGVALAVWVLVSFTGLIKPASTSTASCDGYLQEFLSSQTKEAHPYTGDNLVYFLHVPRTGGRTFHMCFLKYAFPATKRCPKAYDHLRINLTLPNCNLLSSHDDFSVVENLPDRASVISQMRDPVDRFLSAYEFAIEVASRQVTRQSPRADMRAKAMQDGKVLTDNVWPWSHLVPWFEADMRLRALKLRRSKEAVKAAWFQVTSSDSEVFYHNKALNVSQYNLTEEQQAQLLPPLDPYNTPLYMPLTEFIEHPIAQDLLHDGIFFQVLGITNYSHWSQADNLRTCSWQSPSVFNSLLDFARRRVLRFTHVGTTEKLQDSVASCAASLQVKLDGPAYASGESRKANIELKSSHRRRRLAEGEEGEQEEQGEEEADGAAADGSDGGSDEDLGDDQPGRPLEQQQRRFRAARAALQKAIKARAGKAQLEAAKQELSTATAELRSARRKLVEQQGQAEGGAGGDDSQLGINLGLAYQRCAQKAQARSKVRREQALSKLSMPDGRWPVFGRAARKQIPAAVIDRIRELNRADVALHQVALQMLGSARSGFSATGDLQELPEVRVPSNVEKMRVRLPVPKPSKDEL